MSYVVEILPYDPMQNMSSGSRTRTNSGRFSEILLAASSHYVWSLDSLRRARFGSWKVDNGAKSAAHRRET